MKHAGNPNWGKGRSGNPSGRPKGAEGMAAKFRKLADTLGIKNIRALMCSDDEKIRLEATKFVYDRGYGKVTDQINFTGSLSIEDLISGANKPTEK